MGRGGFWNQNPEFNHSVLKKLIIMANNKGSCESFVNIQSISGTTFENVDLKFFWFLTKNLFMYYEAVISRWILKIVHKRLIHSLISWVESDSLSFYCKGAVLIPVDFSWMVEWQTTDCKKKTCSIRIHNG